MNKNMLKSLIRNIILMFIVLITTIFTHKVAHSNNKPNELLYPQVDGWSDNTDNLPLYSNDPWYVPLVYQQDDKNFPGEEVGIAGVVSSLRLKRTRDGIEDYEYIEILKKLEYQDWVMKMVRQVGKDWHNWTKNPQSLDFARYKLGEKINQISS